jgi:hypothetical protein
MHIGSKPREKNKKRNWEHLTVRNTRLFFRLKYRDASGEWFEKYYFADFPYPEAGIQWTNQQRQKITTVYRAIFPETPDNIYFGFLRKGILPSTGDRIQHLEKPEHINAAQILALLGE